MSGLIRVAVVRPKMTGKTAASKLVVALAVFALNAWTLMLVVGAVTPWHLSFRHSVLALVGVGALRRTPEYLSWTHESKGGAR